MLHDSIDGRSERYFQKRHCTLTLRVNNHPGVMSHICGLFARRGFNMEKILCLPIGAGEESKIYLMVDEHQNIEQIRKQLAKLEDVLAVGKAEGEMSVFERIEGLLKENVKNGGFTSGSPDCR